MSEFKIKPILKFGKDSLNELSSLKYQSALIITDQSMLKFGIADSVISSLKSSTSITCFPNVTPDPDITVIASGMNTFLVTKPDLVIAVGGGSVIDAAKGILFALAKDNKLEEKPYFIAIPTTSGTGSEVTSFSVIKSKNQKWVIVDDYMLPDLAILDPVLVKSVPSQITADTGMDVLCHALETYVSTSASDFTDALAEKAAQLVFKHLVDCYQHGDDLNGREKLHNASYIAGMAFTNASLGITHSLAHALGGQFKIPHGRANSLLMSNVVAFNADYKGKCDTSAAKKYCNLAKTLGLPSSNTREGVCSLILAIDTLRDSLNMPNSIKECGVTDSAFVGALKDMSQLALKDGCTPTNPKQPSLVELERLYKNSFLQASISHH
ncbi:iron-containing alcohol dehydrogenase [Photobacterium leiognathi]|uniref:1-propanol dehydrogenase PduQ n=1 Tax=Photobacterium leiognathi TaxID=553611 RepID=UPI001EDE8E98|nr:1-propanol dehydrogenase PduQ [Photobacterium leiognathi]MCG3884848.1 iron-containing alcohol dehydrogenase [Photobacterium leiognathi]